MGNSNCSCKSSTKSVRDKIKRSTRTSKITSHTKSVKNLQFRVEHPIILSNDDFKLTSFVAPTIPFGVVPRSKVKVMNLEIPVAGEQAYEGEDEHDDRSMSMKRENSDFDLHAHSENSNGLKEHVNDSFCFDVNDQHKVITDKFSATDDDVINKARSGHMSDPGPGKADQFSASPQLKRSCSDPMMRGMVNDTGNVPCSESFEQIQKLMQKMNDDILPVYYGSPLSMRSHFSADIVMLKNHSSSQILPSRSRRLWWKLFLWSHRNLHSAGHGETKPKLISNLHGGYSSETLEARKSMESSKSRGSFTGESIRVSDDNHSRGGFQGNAGLWPQNQWVAFPAESTTMSRIEQWVMELPVEQPPLNDYINDHNEDGTAIPPPDMVAHIKVSIPEEIVHANSVIQSLNSSTSVAHMAGMGLKVIPSISYYSSLRSVNLSGNFIVHITPGSLPKGLHFLDLSRNRINAIEGLRELTHIRVLNLSYNRISRIGQGLSNCVLIKELHLAGNKIGEVEGLHRLLKLTVLDLSFNKIITTKALGQLVANYNSLLALNLIGNPIQSNISDDQLRKTMRSLLPKLAYLNRQPISLQKAREVHTGAIVKAATGDGGRSKRKNPVKRTHRGSPSSSVYDSKIRPAHKSRHPSKSQTHHHSALKKSSLLPSTSN